MTSKNDQYKQNPEKKKDQSTIDLITPPLPDFLVESLKDAIELVVNSILGSRDRQVSNTSSLQTTSGVISCSDNDVITDSQRRHDRHDLPVSLNVFFLSLPFYLAFLLFDRGDRDEISALIIILIFHEIRPYFIRSLQLNFQLHHKFCST